MNRLITRVIGSVRKHVGFAETQGKLVPAKEEQLPLGVAGTSWQETCRADPQELWEAVMRQCGALQVGETEGPAGQKMAFRSLAPAGSWANALSANSGGSMVIRAEEWGGAGYSPDLADELNSDVAGLPSTLSWN